jgi:hypothetical protein
MLMPLQPKETQCLQLWLPHQLNLQLNFYGIDSNKRHGLFKPNEAQLTSKNKGVTDWQGKHNDAMF